MTAPATAPQAASAFLHEVAPGGERLIGRDEVAHKLGLTPGRFARRRRRLLARGFPKPHPALPGRWHEAAVDAWIRGDAPRVESGPEGPLTIEIHGPQDDAPMQPDPVLLARLDALMGALP